MKPTTKKEKLIMSLSATLPKITEQQKRWINRKHSSHFSIHGRKYICLECNHKFPIDHVYIHEEQTVCPGCMRKVLFIDERRKDYSVLITMAIITTVDTHPYFVEIAFGERMKVAVNLHRKKLT